MEKTERKNLGGAALRCSVAGLSAFAICIALLAAVSQLIRGGVLPAGSAGVLAVACALAGALAGGALSGRGGGAGSLTRGLVCGILMMLLLLLCGVAGSDVSVTGPSFAKLCVSCVAGGGAGSVLSSYKNTKPKKRKKRK